MAEESAAKSPIIIKKVNKGHGGHHGGAWKIAYADFVTAMMAFF
jgi:chemotaxis protein MotB